MDLSCIQFFHLYNYGLAFFSFTSSSYSWICCSKKLNFFSLYSYFKDFCSNLLSHLCIYYFYISSLNYKNPSIYFRKGFEIFVKKALESCTIVPFLIILIERLHWGYFFMSRVMIYQVLLSLYDFYVYMWSIVIFFLKIVLLCMFFKYN